MGFILGYIDIMKTSYIQKFMFDELPIKGSYVVLDDCWQIIAAQREYPQGLEQLLGELLAANVLLTNNLKLNGKVICQIQDNPAFKLVVSECSHDGVVRATAKFAPESESVKLYSDYFEEGHLVVSIDSKADGQMYQSIIAFNGDNIGDILNNYMLQSEQLKSWFLISYTPERIVGFMLQQLPDVHNDFSEDIERVFMLANTLTHSELSHDKIERLLTKLFNEDNVVVMPPHPVKFACSCSRQRVAGVLRSLGSEELNSMILEQGNIKVDCDYCNAEYKFSSKELELFVMQLSLDELPAISEQIN